MAKNGKIQTFSTVRKSLNTHGTLSVYLLCRLITVSWFQKNRFGEIVNSGSQSNSKVQSTLTLAVVGAPQMTLQQYLSTFPCPPLPPGNLLTPFLSIIWCYLPISSSVFLSFLLLSLSPAELSSPCQSILRCGHTVWVSVSSPWFGGHHALHVLDKTFLTFFAHITNE